MLLNKQVNVHTRNIFRGLRKFQVEFLGMSDIPVFFFFFFFFFLVFFFFFFFFFFWFSLMVATCQTTIFGV